MSNKKPKSVYSYQDVLDYQKKADKYDKLVDLAKEENYCRNRIKQIAQERSKLIGVVDKYKDLK